MQRAAPNWGEPPPGVCCPGSYSVFSSAHSSRARGWWPRCRPRSHKSSTPTSLPSQGDGLPVHPFGPAGGSAQPSTSRCLWQSSLWLTSCATLTGRAPRRTSTWTKRRGWRRRCGCCLFWSHVWDISISLRLPGDHQSFNGHKDVVYEMRKPNALRKPCQESVVMELCEELYRLMNSSWILVVYNFDT